MLNRKGASYPQIQRDVESNVAVSSAPGFAIEYMTAILAAKQNQVSTGYVYAVKNPFYDKPTEEDERTRTMNFIGGQTALLGKTPARQPIIDTLLQQDTKDKLYSVFDRTLVDEVTDVMQKSLVAP